MPLYANELRRFVDPTGRCSHFQLVPAVAAYFGLAVASDDEMERAHALATSQVRSASVSAEAFQTMQRRTGCSIFVAKELGHITGVLAFFPLTQEGVDALESGKFDATAVPAEYVAAPGTEPAGGYCWGFAGSTERARKAVVKGSLAIAETLWWGLPGYGRIATEDGARVVLGKLGFELIAGDHTGLARRPARSEPLMGLLMSEVLAA